MQPPIVPASLAGVVFQVLTLGQPPLVVGLLLVAGAGRLAFLENKPGVTVHSRAVRGRSRDAECGSSRSTPE